MAKLPISEAARVAGVARSTLHWAMKQGCIRIDPDGRLDTAELLRAGYTLHPVAHQVAIAVSDRAIQALQRERDPLQQQSDATHDLLQRERQATLEHERATCDREALLLQMLHEAQQRYDRLLEAPRTSAPAEGSPPALPRTTPGPSAPRGIPNSWRAIITYMQTQPGSQRPQDIQQALGRTQPVRHIMHRMRTAGLLTQIAPGLYTLEGLDARRMR